MYTARQPSQVATTAINDASVAPRTQAASGALPSTNDDFNAMPDTFYLPEVAKRQTRSKHVCPGCDTKIYGKATLNVICGDCELPFERE